MKPTLKYLILSTLFIILTNCSTDETEENQNSEEENPITDRYKLSFQAISGNGEKHFKAIYKLGFDEPIIVDYDILETANTAITGFITFNTLPNELKLELEMKENGTYLHNFNVKIEDFQNNITIGEMDYDGWYIIPTDLLTEREFLNDLYDISNPNTFEPRNNYKFKYGRAGSSTSVSLGRKYDYRDDILVHKQTRGSLRIVVDNWDLNSDYTLNIPNGWAIRDYTIGGNANGYNNILTTENSFSNNVDKTYELILPGHNNTTTITLQGDNTQATIYLMRKDGTMETVNIHSENNELITTEFNL